MMVAVTRIGKEQLINEFGTNRTSQFINGQPKFVRASQAQLSNGLKPNMPHRFSYDQSKLDVPRRQPLSHGYFASVNMKSHPIIVQSSPYEHSKRAVQNDWPRVSSMKRNPIVCDVSNIRSLQMRRQTMKRDRQRCAVSLKSICCCVVALLLIGAIAAVTTVLILHFSNTSTTAVTTDTTMATTTTSMILTLASQVNWVVNGDAETGSCESGAGVTSPTSWNYNGSITQIYYNNINGDVNSTDPGPSNRGQCYFYGQLTNTTTSMWQTVNISVSNNAVLIDNQKVRFNFSAWLGGYRSQDDNARVSLTFMDQSNQMLGNTTTLGPVLAADRGSVSSLLFRQTDGLVPIGARSFLITVLITCVFPTTADGDIDNIVVFLYQ